MSSTKFADVARRERYREARRRLGDRTAATALRIDARLNEVDRRHGLTWRLLLSSQRRVMRQVRVPTATDYFQIEAAPIAAAFTKACVLALEPELDAVDDAIDRFHRSVGVLIGDTEVEALVRADAAAVVQPLLQHRVDRARLDELGERWQARLHRQAIRRCLWRRPTVFGARLSEAAAAEELAMLDQPPWAHGDRLLAAFEIAHAEVRDHLRARVLAAPSVIVAGRPARQLDATP